MKAIFKPGKLNGQIDAPPSKSMAHRYLIGAALSGGVCTLTGVDFSEDILATIDCLRALGASVTVGEHTAVVDSEGFMQAETPVLNCRESGSTLRFFIPIALCLGRNVTFCGSERLFARPLSIYEELCREKGFAFKKEKNGLTLCGKLESGIYRIRGDVSSQFITGLMFALVYLGKDAAIAITPPLESCPYLELTVSALRAFGADIAFAEDHKIEIKAGKLHALSCSIEGDCSNAAFLDAFNRIGSQIEIGNLKPDTLQGDRVYSAYFAQLADGTPTLDISNCPDLGPVLFALAALKNGAVFTGTDRLKIKESDRGAAMHEELRKLGGGLLFGDNKITVPKQKLCYRGIELDGHNDHRIVMALAVILSQTGGVIDGAQAVRKSYPGFFKDIKQLGAAVELV